MKGRSKVGSKMHKAFNFLFLVVFLVLISCKSTDIFAIDSNQNLEMERIVQENYSGFEKEQLLVIKSQEELQSFYGIVNRTRKPGLEPPSIDFNAHILLVWCGGAKGHPNSTLDLRKGEDYLYVRKIDSKIEANEKQHIVSPFSIYKLPKSTQKIKFQ